MGARRWTREKVIEAIRKRHPLLLSRTWRQDHPLYDAAKSYFGTWRKALAAAGIAAEPQRRWTTEGVLAAIRARAAEGLSLTSVWREDASLYGAAERYFGSWRRALLAVGIMRPTARKWGRRRVLAALRTRKRRGLPVTSISQTDKKLYTAAYRAFGSWQGALEAAGIAYKPRKIWSKQRVMAELAAAQRSPTKNIRQLDQGLVGAVWRYFGGVTKARRAAELERRPKKWSRELVIEAIQNLHVSGQSIQTANWRQNRALAMAAKHYFRSWDDALVAAGLLKESEKPAPKRIWTPEAVIQAIQARHQQGLPMTGVRKEGGGVCDAACKHFGGWTNALRAAGIEPRSTRRWTKQAVLQAIRARHQQGLPLDKAWIDSQGLYWGARKHFGRWRVALIAARVPVGKERKCRKRR
jgi:hypothetical protein